jgi:group I intron endonuclease
MGYIYLAINTINGKCYVGKTVRTLAVRRDGHVRDAGHKSPLYFHRALAKYGPEAFEWSVLDECDDLKVLNALERLFIRRLNTRSPNGYNLTDGGEGGCGNHSEETKRKIGAKSKLKWNFERPCHPNTKNAASKYWRGRKRSEETKRKMSISNKGKIQSAISRAKIGASSRGRKVSEETKRKMSEAHMGHPTSEETRRRISESLLKTDALKQAAILNRQKRIESLKQWNRYRDWESCSL